MNRSRGVNVLLGALLVMSCQGDESTRDYPTVPESALKGTARTNLDSPTPTKAQLERRKRSLEILEAKGLPYLATLPVVEDESSVRPRPAEEVIHRCLSILVCAVKGETNDDQLVADLRRDYEVAQHLSPNERAFLDNPHPGQQDLVDYSWQYEAVHVLLWSQGFLPELEQPNQQARVPALVQIVKGRSPRDLIAAAKPRPLSQVLDMADLYYHLHWSAIELRLRTQQNPAVHEGTVRERHRALNWLIRYMNSDWDDVTTDT
jgi:hypothetical protein